MPEKDYLKAYHYESGTVHHEAGPAATATVRPGPGMPGGHSSVSANGSAAGIVWTLRPVDDATVDPRAVGMLHAFNGVTLAELWNDPQPELFAKFNPPTIADGKVFRPVFAQYEIPDSSIFDYTTQRVTVVSRAPGNLDLFVIGFDNHVWSTYWTAQGGWSQDGWFPLPGEAVFDHTTQQLAAVSRQQDKLDLFVLGFDNHAWTTFWDGTNWNSDWFALVPPLGPAPLYKDSGKIIVYGLVSHDRTARASDHARSETIEQFVQRHRHRGALARPLGPEVGLGDDRGGRRRDFAGTIGTRQPRMSTQTVVASVFRSNETGPRLVIGEIRNAYLRHGGPTGPLGYPVAGDDGKDRHRDRISHFERGEITWDPRTGAHVRQYDRPS